MKSYHEGRRGSKLFMGFVSVVLSVMIVAMSTLTAFAYQPSNAAVELEPLVFTGVDCIESQEICLITFNGLEQEGADSEGRAIIGGDLVAPQGWSASVKSKFANDYALIVEGDVTTGGYLSIGGCAAQTAGRSWPEGWTWDCQGNCSHGVGTAENGYDSRCVHIDNSGWITKYLDAAEAAFKAASETYAATATDGNVSINGGTATLSPSASHEAGTPHIFNIDGEAIYAVNFSGDWGSDMILINISGTNPTCYSAQDSETYLQQNAVWNYYEAETLSISSASVQGSLLAPYATFTGSNGHVNGTTIVNKMIGAGGFEYHTGHFFKNPFSSALSVKKTVEGETDVDETFNFTLSTASGQLVEEFSLKAGEVWRFSDLSENQTYVVTELASSENFTFGGVTANGNYDSISGSSVTFTASDGSSRDIVFTNNAVEKIKTGSLQINKVYSGSESKTFNFTLYTSTNGSDWDDGTTFSIDYPANSQYVFNDLPVNNYYKVTESVDESLIEVRYEGIAYVSGSATSGFQIAEGTNVLTCYNTVRTGSLEVSKSVAGGNAADEFTFRVYEKKNGAWAASSIADFTLKAGETKTFSGLVYGTEYAVAEISTGNYNFAGVTGTSTSVEGYPASSFKMNKELQSVTFTNELKVGGIAINKLIDGEGSGEFTFKLEKKSGDSWAEVETFTLTAGGAPKTYTNLEAGSSYRVSEVGMGDGFELKSISGDCTVDGDYAYLAVPENGQAVATFTNALKSVSLTVNKKLNDASATSASTFNFSVLKKNSDGSWSELTDKAFTMSVEDGKTATYTVEGLTWGGSYKVVENDAASYYTVVTSGSTTAIGKSSDTIVLDGAKEVTFENTKQVTITINKEIVAGETDLGENFTMKLQKRSGTSYNDVKTFNLKAGASETFTVDAGYYRVVEAQNSDNYVYASYDLTGGAGNGSYASASISGTEYMGASFRLSDDGAITITNTIKRASITVAKILQDSVAPKTSFEFSIEKKVGDSWYNEGATITLANGEAAAFENLEFGATYRIVEKVNGELYTTTVSAENESGYISGNTSEAITISKESNSVVFNNVRRTANLTVTKSLANGSADLGEEFEVTVSKFNGSAWVAVEGGTFTLKAGQSKTLALEVGVVYKVAETETGASYVLDSISGADENGKVDLSADTTVGIVNRIKEGTLEISKVLVDTVNPNSSFTFNIYEVNDGRESFVQSVTIDANSSTKITGLPYGSTYIVKELSAGAVYNTTYKVNGGEAVSGTEATVTIGTQAAKVEFTNERKTAKVSVTKKLSEGSNEIAGESFTFKIYRKSGTEWVDSGIAEFTLNAGETKSGIELEVGAEYCVAETSTGASYVFDDSYTDATYAYVPDAGVTFTLTEDGKDVTIYNKNKEAEIVVRKSVVGGETNNDLFTFELWQKIGTEYVKVASEQTVAGGKVTFNSSNVDANYPMYLGNEYKVIETNIGDRYELSEISGAANVTLSQASAEFTLDGANDITYVNSVKTGKIVIKKTLNDTLDSDATFTFNAYRKSGSEWIALGSKVLGGKDTWTISDLPYGTVVKVTEDCDASIYTTTVTGLSDDIVTINSATTNVEFTNTRKTTELTVEKKLYDGGEALNETFGFTLYVLKGDDWKQVSTFSLKADGKETLSGLMVGATYRVVESTVSDSFNYMSATGGTPITYNGANGVDLVLEQSGNAVVVTNAVKRAALTVTKAVEGEANGDSFSFKLQKKNGSAWDDVETFTLGAANNYTKTFESVAVGDEYRVTELDLSTRYTLTKIEGTDVYDIAAKTADAVITEDGQSIVFTNTVNTGKLVVSKTVVDSIAANSKFAFTLYKLDTASKEYVAVESFELGNSGSKEFTGLSYGDTYKVVEAVTGTTYKTTCAIGGGEALASSEAVVTISNASTDVKFTNTRETAQLSLTKALKNGTSDESFTFALYKKVNDNWVQVEDAFTLKADETKTWTVEVNADYRITETIGEGSSYEFSTATFEGSATDGSVKTVDGVLGYEFNLSGNTDVTFTNELKKASLTVTKQIKSGTTDETFEFELLKKNGEKFVSVETFTLAQNESKVFDALTYGDTYKVVETATGKSYQLDAIDGADSKNLTEASGTVTIDGAEKIFFTNAVKTAKVVVTKTLVDNTDSTKSFGFTVYKNDETTPIGTFSLANGESETIESGVKYGTICYGDVIKVVETDTGIHTTTVKVNDAAAAAGIVEIAQDVENIEFINTRNKATLAVAKTIKAGDADLGETFKFKLEKREGISWKAIEVFELKNGESKSFELDVAAEYKVTETNTGASYDFGYVSGASAVTGENAGIITLDEDSTVTFVNLIKTGSVSVKKELIDKYDTNAEFAFTISDITDAANVKVLATGSIGSGETLTAENIPYGTKVQVSENVRGDIYASIISGDGENGIITVNSPEVSMVATNERKTASIIVTKAIASGDNDLGESFTFALYRQELDGSFKKVATSDPIKAGESYTFKNLYVGIDYKVVETSTGKSYQLKGVDSDAVLTTVADGTDVYTGALVNLVEGGDDVTFTNMIKRAGFTVSKALTGVGVAAADDEFTFTCEQVTAQGNVLVEEFTLKAGEIKTFENLQMGDQYIVTEVTDAMAGKYEFVSISGATLTDGTSATVTITEDAQALVFNNTVKDAKLSVTKNLEDKLASDTSFEFELQVLNGETWEKVEAFTLAGGQTRTFTVKQGDTYKVVETASGEEYTTTVTVDGVTTGATDTGAIEINDSQADVIFKNVRKTVDFSIRKTVSEVTEDDEEFTINVTGVFADSTSEYTKTYIFNKTGEGEDENATYAKLADEVAVEDVLYGGTYTIEEIGATYYSCYINGVEGTSAEIVAEPNTVGDVSNVRKTADLTVTKAISKGKDLGESFNFQLYVMFNGEWKTVGDEFTLKANESKTIEGLAIGRTYKVVETETGENYVFDSISRGSDLVSENGEKGATFTLNADKTVVISNKIKTNSITVRKKVAEVGGDAEAKFEFELFQLVDEKWTSLNTFTLSANESKTIEGLDIGETYKVVENITGDAYEFGGVEIDNMGKSDSVITEEQAAVVVLNGAEDITFTNNPSKKTLTVKKEVNGESGEDTFSFALYRSVAGEWTQVKTFSLEAGEKEEFEVIYGVQYKVVEINTGKNYVLESIDGADSLSLTDAAAIVKVDDDELITYTNTLKVGAVNISKMVSGVVTGDTSFKFIVTDEDGKAFKNDVLDANGMVTINAGSTVVLENVPYGTSLIFTEVVNEDDYTTTYTVGAGSSLYYGATTVPVLVEKEITSVTFTNAAILKPNTTPSYVLGANSSYSTPTTGVTTTPTVSNVLGEDMSIPATGDDMPVSVFVVVAVTSLAVLIISKKRRVTA